MLVVSSDIHLGKYKLGKINPATGTDFRTDDILFNFDYVIDYAISKKAKYFVITGDFYHTKRPLQIFRKLFAARISRVLESGMKVFLLLGNHDQGKTESHDLIELLEMSKHIDNLYVIDQTQSIKFDDVILYFVPCINRVDLNIENENNYFREGIQKFTKEAKQEDPKVFKIFFGHFGTDASTIGNSFDLGTLDKDKKRLISLKEFDSVFTKVYLGDIHQHQEMNSFVRHPGSIAKVDFGEENEQKGFYYFEKGEDKFIKINDREFKTFEVDLINEPRETMKQFCSEIQELDLTEVITRMKIKIKSSDKKLIKFDAIENYLREVSKNYIGRTLIEVDDKLETEMRDFEELNYMQMFSDYCSRISLDEDIKEELKNEGKLILSEVLNK